MKKFTLLFGIVLAMSFSLRSEVILVGSDAQSIVQNAELIRYKDGVTNPSFIRFKMGQGPSENMLSQFLNEHFSKEQSFQYEVIRSEEDELGFRHIRLQQKVSGSAIEMATLIVHIKNGKIHSVNGYSIHDPEFDAFVLDESQALKSALAQIDAQVYMWELPGESNALYYPKGRALLLPEKFDFTSSKLTPCYKFDIYANTPLYRANVYVSAINGDILFEDMTIKHVDSTGTAITSFSGQRSFITDYNSTTGTFTMKESGRGNGIFTRDMLNGTNTGNAVDITNTTNFWPDTLRYRYASDAHWGAEQVYDYFLNNHNRNSIDGNGFALVSYVHYGQGYNNAFWNGQAMHYGDGSGGNLPYTTVDICGHEISHGLTSNTAGLIYQNESGALNESFSDIFGCAIEVAVKPNPTKNWLMGEDRGSHIRSMSNPNQRNDPDTYEGNFWYSGTADNGGVHTNSGVQNFWFYLLTNGGSGTNDKNDLYSVTGLGVAKAEKIAFRNLTVYLTQSSDYEDARFYAAESAVDLYGPCSAELESTMNAWYACGVGDEYKSGVLAQFSATRTSICAIPAQVDFINESNRYNIQNYLWDFGDGQTSTMENPSHVYATPGSYTVKLTASHNTCGTDVESKTSYIVITPPSAATGNDVVSCINYPAQVVASGTGQVKWYSDNMAQNLIHLGNTYVSPILNKDTVFYAQNSIPSASQNVGPDTIIGFGQYFNAYQYLIFDVYDYMTLESVVVFSGSTGSRTIELRSSTGQILDSKTVTIPKGTQTVQLEFDISPGYDYQLGVSFGTVADLYRYSSGTRYPYTLNGLMSITKSSAGTDPLGYYYFFFDWKVRAQDCQSVLTPIKVTMDETPSCEPFWSGIEKNDAGFTWEIYPNPAGQQFSLEFTLAEAGPVQAEIFDMHGRSVLDVVNTSMTGGSHLIEVDASSLSRGMYMVRMRTANGIFNRQLSILK